ncbi:NAD binding domain of 6-phosphogluconate dehydrogenase-domain-containing protein [Phaeosphaeria sp. MPI-PUGE-AT-0046c]|nr:NAD binding domain of 6-phosphogluconate dehydrogenase-domain-containing protein [Phaeosphaeria sp. MPI-PUGE-AT-0046c]
MTSETTLSYGFIGIGQMGYGMAQNLRKKISRSSRFTICELDQNRRDQFISEADGPVEIAATPAQVAEQSDVVITMLPKGVHVLDVFTNPSTGLLSVPKKATATRFIDCSTIDVATSLQVKEKVSESQAGSFIDAPVSGGPNGARAGSLTIMVGGPEESYNSALHVLQIFGKNVFHCGPSGAGLATKFINNYLSAITTIGTCEAMNMGLKYGLDAKVLAGVINSSSGRSYNSLEQNPVKGVTPGAASENDFEGGFSVELSKGVLEMSVALARQVKAQTLMDETVLRVYTKAVSDSRTAGKDTRSVIKLFADGDA